MKADPYKKCPVFETEHFILRLVAQEDAADLLTCYADAKARPIFNSDTCTSDFFFDTAEEMGGCIKMWLGSYDRREFLRFSIVSKESGHAVGTIEMFGMVGVYKTERGILRLDIASKHEQEAYLEELFSICIGEFFDLFGVRLIVTKAVPEAAQRVEVLKKLGFAAYDFPEREHYWVYSR